MSNKRITIQEVQNLLDQGKKRKEIAEHFDLNSYEIKELFKHPKLKNKRPRKEKRISFELIDEEEINQETSDEGVEDGYQESTREEDNVSQNWNN